MLDIIDLHDTRRVPLNQAERAAKPGAYPYFGANGQVATIGDYLFDGDYVLLAEDGGYFDKPARGVAYEVAGRFWVNNHAHIVKSRGRIPHRFLCLLLNSIDWMPYVSGTTRLKLTQGGMSRVSVSLPPLSEQHRIVAKLDALLIRLARARAELERTAKLTMRLRRSTLSDAFSGALTRDVRFSGDEENVIMQPDLDDQERGAWVNGALPRGWTWVTFDEFFEDWTDSQRKIPEKSYLEKGTFPVVDQGQKFIGGFCNDESMVQAVALPAIVFGDHTRCVKFLEQKFVQGADGTKVLRAASGIESRFAYYALLAIEIPAKGYSRHMKFVRKSVWPRPSLDEQREIVARVEATFARADRLEAEAARATKLLDRLEASILAKAFRGELVPQDPADEPATVLLDRIRAESAVASRSRSAAGRAEVR